MSMRFLLLLRVSGFLKFLKFKFQFEIWQTFVFCKYVHFQGVFFPSTSCIFVFTIATIFARDSHQQYRFSQLEFHYDLFFTNSDHLKTPTQSLLSEEKITFRKPTLIVMANLKPIPSWLNHQSVSTDQTLFTLFTWLWRWLPLRLSKRQSNNNFFLNYPHPDDHTLRILIL